MDGEYLNCDLQDRPEEIPRLYDLVQEGAFDLVYAQRYARRDSFFRRLASRAFYSLFSFLTDTKQDASIANFGIYSREVVRAILSMRDSTRYFPTMSQWVGFRRGYLRVEHSERVTGKSSYSLLKLMALAVSNIIAFSNKPLRLTVLLGLSICALSCFVAAYYVTQYLRGQIIVLGYTSLMLSIWFIGGVLIALLGMVGLYVGYTFERVKGRPLYIVRDRVGEFFD